MVKDQGSRIYPAASAGVWRAIRSMPDRRVPSNSATSAFVLDVLKTVGDADLCGEVWWRCDGNYAPVTFLANCSDTFWWATADAEPITPENLAAFKQAIADCGDREEWAPALFAARVRGMRPMRATYRDVKDERLVALFNACGPERDPKEEG